MAVYLSHAVKVYGIVWREELGIVGQEDVVRHSHIVECLPRYGGLIFVGRYQVEVDRLNTWRVLDSQVVDDSRWCSSVGILIVVAPHNH